MYLPVLATLSQEHADLKVLFCTSYICLSKAAHQASTLKSPVFLLSANHLSTHFFIVSLLFALPTLTVGITFSILSAQQNIVSSLKLECSEYGTPKQLAFFVLPLCGTSSLIV